MSTLHRGGGMFTALLWARAEYPRGCSLTRWLYMWRNEMLKPQPRPVPPRCPRCRGPLLRDYDRDYQCLYCGEYVYTTAHPAVWRPLVPEGPRKRGRPRKQPLMA